MENQNNPFETEQEQTPQGGGGYAAAARPARRGLYTIICVLALLTVAAVLMRSQAFRVYDHTEVIGLSSFSRDDVMRLAGITRGTTYFGIDEEAIRKGINSNRYLDYEGLEKIWPNMLILMVKERTPCVNFLYRGVQYTLADDTTHPRGGEGAVPERAAKRGAAGPPGGAGNPGRAGENCRIESI